MASGTDRIAAAFATAREEGRAGPMPYMMGGFPDPEASAAIADAYVEGRAHAVVPLVAPTTPAERRARICERAEGFVYVVSDTRVTGERDDLPEGLADLVAAVKSEAAVPAAVGFGIGTPQQAAAVGQIADGVI